jgi:hypothetical protein
MNTMTETGTVDRPSIAKPASRPRSRKAATVSASALALHLDCSRAGDVRLPGEIEPLCASLSRTGLLLPASAYGEMIYMPTPWLTELATLADIEGIAAAK